MKKEKEIKRQKIKKTVEMVRGRTFIYVSEGEERG